MTLKYIILNCLVLCSGFLAAQEEDYSYSTFPVDVILDSTMVPVEIYDSTTFVNWPNTPPMLGYNEVDQEPVALNNREIISDIGYPKLFIDAGVSLSCRFRILIDTEGEVVRIIGMNEWMGSLAADDGQISQPTPMVACLEGWRAHDVMGELAGDILFCTVKRDWILQRSRLV